MNSLIDPGKINRRAFIRYLSLLAIPGVIGTRLGSLYSFDSGLYLFQMKYTLPAGMNEDQFVREQYRTHHISKIEQLDRRFMNEKALVGFKYVVEPGLVTWTYVFRRKIDFIAWDKEFHMTCINDRAAIHQFSNRVAVRRHLSNVEFQLIDGLRTHLG